MHCRVLYGRQVGLRAYRRDHFPEVNTCIAYVQDALGNGRKKTAGVSKPTPSQCCVSLHAGNRAHKWMISVENIGAHCQSG